MNPNMEIQGEQIPHTSEKLLRRSLAFVPGVYVVLVLSGILILLIGFGILYSLEHVLSVFISAFSIQIAFAAGLGMIIGIIGVLKGLYRAIWGYVGYENALPVDAQTEPELFELINDLCAEMNCEVPDVVILHADPSFFVMDGKLNIVHGTVSGTILCISLPMLSFLTVHELRSILAHEFAHFTGWDVAYSRKVLPVYHGVLSAVNQVNRGGSVSNLGYGPLMSIPNVLPIALLNAYLRSFHKINMTISRSREQRADTIAAVTCGTEAVTNALKKVHSIGNVFSAVAFQHLTGEYKNGRGFINYYDVFRAKAEEMKGDIRQQLELELNRISTKESSHPTLSERISYLPNVPNKHHDDRPAVSLLVQKNGYERELSDALSAALNA